MLVCSSLVGWQPSRSSRSRVGLTPQLCGSLAGSDGHYFSVNQVLVARPLHLKRNPN
jgi:hypothetical protein